MNIEKRIKKLREALAIINQTDFPADREQAIRETIYKQLEEYSIPEYYLTLPDAQFQEAIDNDFLKPAYKYI